MNDNPGNITRRSLLFTLIQQVRHMEVMYAARRLEFCHRINVGLLSRSVHYALSGDEAHRGSAGWLADYIFPPRLTGDIYTSLFGR